jgi:large subunit ribosomal protein L4
MELQLSGSKSNKKKIELSDTVFNCKFNEPLVHQVVVAYLATGRAGTHGQKTRAEVRGGGIKPWRQKGTGRARAGTIRSPIWRKGGKVFAAVTQSYAQKVNKKMYRGAIRSILSELIRQERVTVVEEMVLDQPKTKSLLNMLAEFNVQDKKTLIVTEAVDQNLYLAARNLQRVDVRDVAAVDPVSLVGIDNMLITVAALKQYEELLK